LWIALQPGASATRSLALQRGAGTVVGALVTLAFGVVVPHTIWLGWVLAVLAFVAFGLRTVNYAWYCVVLTPIVVLGFAGQPLDHRVLAARVAWTTAGVLLAVAARELLWARDERDPQPAASIEAPLVPA
jgi:uncharacterized membrane protein YccC